MELLNYSKIKRDCHYCEYTVCENEKSQCDCYSEDLTYFDHIVKDSKNEAKDCKLFKYCDIFPKN